MAISNEDIKRALILVRDLRLKGMRSNINPKAIRIALKYALLVDDHFAKQRLKLSEEKELDERAKRLFQESLRSWENHKTVIS